MVRLTRSNRHTIDTFFIMALLALFSITSIFVILIGAKQYHSIADRMTENYETRTATSYLVEKFHQFDGSGSVSQVDIEGIPAISLSQEVGESTYYTYIYVYDGYLREITVAEGTTFSPAAAEQLVEASSLTITAYTSNLYCFELVDTYGNSHPIYISMNTK